jgi:hypothetical protein
VPVEKAFVDGYIKIICVVPNQIILNNSDLHYQRLRYWLFSSILLYGCTQKKSTLFSSLSSVKTGISFINQITDTDSLDILDYLYYYNGGGVAIADFNNDGLADIYFTSNLGSNKLYLNKGRFKI